MLMIHYIWETVGIVDLTAHLSCQFHTEDLYILRYFLEIDVARSEMDMYLSQRKYVLNLLSET